MGLAEVGGGVNFGPVQVNLAIGRTNSHQDMSLGGRAESDGTYVFAEALVPVTGSLWATVGGYKLSGDATVRRGYLNGAVQNASTGTPGLGAWGGRIRLDWENVSQIERVGLTPFVDLSHSVARTDGYTESGGSAPGSFNQRKDKISELRLGLGATRPFAAGGGKLVGIAEAAHRFQRNSDRIRGNIPGQFSFDVAGADYKRNWLRVGAGVEEKLGSGTASLMLNATTQGAALSHWLAASWSAEF